MEEINVKENVETLTDKEKVIRKEAFLVGYGTALNETQEILEGILEDVQSSLKAIKEHLEQDETKDETKQDEEKGEQE